MTSIPINTGPTNVLKALRDEAKENTDWFKAVVLTATQLERHGYIALKDYFISLKANPRLVDKMLNGVRFPDISEYIQIIGRIDSKEYKTLLKLNEVRNNFIHRKKGYNYFIGTKANREYEPLVNESIRILEEKLYTPTAVVFRR